MNNPNLTPEEWFNKINSQIDAILKVIDEINKQIKEVQNVNGK